MSTPRHVGAVLIVAALAPQPALAQTNAAPPSGTHAQTAPERREAARIEQHIGELRRRLRITPAEQQQWDLFAQTVRDNAVHMEQLFEARTNAEAMNAVEDLRSYAGIAEARAQDMQRLVPTFEALYRALSADQQKIADTALKKFEERGMRRAPRG